MTPSQWLAHVAETATAPNPARERFEAKRLTLEFNQPLIQEYRRKRPKRRGRPAPLFDPQQKTIGETTR